MKCKPLWLRVDNLLGRLDALKWKRRHFATYPAIPMRRLRSGPPLTSFPPEEQPEMHTDRTGRIMSVANL